MARKSRYMGYVEGLEQLKVKHEKRRKIEKEKSLTRKLNQYKKEMRENEWVKPLILILKRQLSSEKLK